jgi:acetylornithine deacetylase/succinyl-diaminopimelate desuccinylase-like protein
MQDIYDYIDAHADDYVRDLQTLVRQPSISAQNVGLRECAELVQRMMTADGLDAHLHELDGGPPIIIGHMTTPRSARTMLCYSHYDVQPPDPVDAWTYPPWSAEIVDGVMYGRGCSDNKSGILAFNKAAQAFLKVRGELPVNLKFIVEGEEEIGSIHLGPWVERNTELLRADGMHCLDGPVDASTGLPDVDLGLKSVLIVEFIARGTRADVHSLNFPLVPAPVWDLIHALSSIMDRNRRILVEGWYEGLYELEDEDYQQLEEKVRRVDLNALRDEWGIDQFALGRDGVDAVRARAYEPTANVSGIIAGYNGPGAKTIVPHEARAKMDFRLIPNLDPKKAVEKLRAHLDKHGFGHIEIQSEKTAEPPYKISVKESMAQAVIAAATKLYGQAPIVNGVSAEGTIIKHVWIPCVLTGFASPGANLHAPDENIAIDHYIRGIKYAATIMDEFGKGT